MVFISAGPRDDRLVIREAPVIAVPVFVLFAAGFLALAIQFDRSGDALSTWIMFSAMIAGLLLTLHFTYLRTCTFAREARTLEIRHVSAARRSVETHPFGPNARSEVEIDRSDSETTTYQAVFLPAAPGAAERIGLDDNSSFRRPSDRITAALTAWLAEGESRR